MATCETCHGPGAQTIHFDTIEGGVVTTSSAELCKPCQEAPPPDDPRARRVGYVPDDELPF